MFIKLRRKLLITLLSAGCAAVARAAEPELQVIGFEDSLSLQSGDQFIQLTAGSLGFSIPEGVKTTVLLGRATLNAAGTIILVDPGDTFSFLAADGTVQLLVLKGEISVTPPGQPTSVVGPGRFLPLGGLRTAGVAGPPPAPVAPPPPAVEPPAPPKHPLETLGDAFHTLARASPRELKLLIELHPFYALTQTYDSNIYTVPEDKADGSVVGGGVLGGWITQNTVGSKIALPINRRHRLQAVYGLSLLAYSVQPSVNNAASQNFHADYEYTPSRGLLFTLADDFVSTRDPAFSEIVIRKQRYADTMSAKFENTRSRIFVYGLDASITHHKYLDKELSNILNRYEQAFGGHAGMKLRPQAKLFFHYRRGIIHYSAGRGNHSKSHRLGLGLSGRFSPRLKGDVSTGVILRRYDEALDDLSLPQPRTASSMNFAVALSYMPMRRTTLGFNLTRDLQEASFGRSRYYTATGGSLSAGYALGSWAFSTKGGVSVNQYPVSTTIGTLDKFRRDTIYSFGLGADWKIKKWLSSGLSYDHLQRISAFPDSFNYRSHRTSLSVKATF